MKKLFMLLTFMFVGLSGTYSSSTRPYECCSTVTVSATDSDGNSFSASASYCAGGCYTAGVQAGIMANHALNIKLMQE